MTFSFLKTIYAYLKGKGKQTCLFWIPPSIRWQREPPPCVHNTEKRAYKAQCCMCWKLLSLILPLGHEGRDNYICLYVRVWRLKESRQDGQAHTGKGMHIQCRWVFQPSMSVQNIYSFTYWLFWVCPCSCVWMYSWCLHACVCTCMWKPMGNLGCHSSDVINLWGDRVSYYPGTHQVGCPAI